MIICRARPSHCLRNKNITIPHIITPLLTGVNRKQTRSTTRNLSNHTSIHPAFSPTATKILTESRHLSPTLTWTVMIICRAGQHIAWGTKTSLHQTSHRCLKPGTLNGRISSRRTARTPTPAPVNLLYSTKLNQSAEPKPSTLSQQSCIEINPPLPCAGKFTVRVYPRQPKQVQPAQATTSCYENQLIN
jgi:hypothetical protein